MTKRLLIAGTGLVSFLFPACAGLVPRDNTPPAGAIVYERKPWQHGPGVAAIPAPPYARGATTSGMMAARIAGQPLDLAALHPPAPVDANVFATTPPIDDGVAPMKPRRDVASRTTSDAPETAPVPRSIEPRVIVRPDWPSLVPRASSPERERASGIRIIPPDAPIPSADSIATPALLPRALPPMPSFPVAEARVREIEPIEPPTRPVLLPAPTAIAPPTPSANTASVVANSPQAETILLRIIRAFQENRPQEAIEILNGVDPQYRDLLIFLVPIVTDISERPASPPSQEQLGAMADRLQEALVALRSKAPLKFETTCYATKIDGYGRFTRLEKGTFAPGSRTQLYLELKNLSWLPGTLPPQKDAKPQKGYLLHLVCQIEIQDNLGRVIWKSEPMERRDFRQTVPGDFHLTPSFGVPESLTAGAYKLSVQVTDKPTGRTIRTALDFLVSGERR